MRRLHAFTSIASLLSATAAVAASPLQPRALNALPYASVSPQGWLLEELQVQANGLSGAFPEFWGPVTNATWIGGNNKYEDWVEIFPYVLNGYVGQALLLKDPNGDTHTVLVSCC